MMLDVSCHILIYLINVLYFCILYSHWWHKDSREEFCFVVQNYGTKFLLVDILMTLKERTALAQHQGCQARDQCQSYFKWAICNILSLFPQWSNILALGLSFRLPTDPKLKFPVKKDIYGICIAIMDVKGIRLNNQLCYIHVCGSSRPFGVYQLWCLDSFFWKMQCVTFI